MELCSKKEKVLMVEDTVSMTSTREPDKSQDHLSSCSEKHRQTRYYHSV